MPNQPLLPKLKDNQGMGLVSEGTWESKSLPALDKLSISIKAERNGSSFDINAIPDMWARPLLFQIALFDKEHLLYEQIKGEWRGLLAILALKDIWSIDISVKSVVIPEKNEILKDTPRFVATLSKLLPMRNTIASDTSWNHLYTILCNEQPIGITSPTTIVCTAANYDNRISSNVKWYNGKCLVDPIPFLNRNDKYNLQIWLNNLKNDLANYEHINGKESYISISNLLLDFIGDLNVTNLGNIKYTINDGNCYGFDYGFFKLLNHSLECITSGYADSQIILKCLSDKQKSACNLLIIDKNVSSQWHIPEQDIVVDGSTTLANVHFDKINLPLNIKKCEPQNYFFTEKMYVIAEIPNAFPGSVSGIRGFSNLKYRGVAITPILPLNPEILNYLSINDLIQRFSFESITNGYKVKLRLPLSGPDQNGREFEIEREYKIDVDIDICENIPLIEIWPNFKSETWKAYYMYYDNTGLQKVFYAKPFVQGTIVPKTIKENKNLKEREITFTDYFPDALICEYSLNSVTQPIGLILLNQPEFKSSANGTWKIGIDFGTTGTNVYFREDDDYPPQPVEFQEYLFNVTNSSSSQRASIQDYFIMIDPKRPFLSMFHKFQIQTKVREPLLDGHIYSLTSSGQLKANDGKIMVNLKWGESSEERDNARVFLEQLCLQCSAEAVMNNVKKISWRFSFPTAFTPEDKQYFVAAWENICNNCRNKTGIELVEENPISLSESVAIALFFTDKKNIKNNHGFTASIYRGVVCIDIGGGTTDISIWQGPENELKGQTSLLYAGRALFLEIWRANHRFLEQFGVEEDNLNILMDKKDKDKEFYAQLDAIIMQKGTDMLARIPSIGGNIQFKKFVNIIALGLAGLFHYIGLLLNDLHNQSRYDNKWMPYIYIGGNGANLFHWVSGGKHRHDSPINSLFKNILLQATEFKVNENDDFEIIFSESFKAEVACGLVNDGIELKYKNNKEDQKVIAGENFIFNNQECSWGTELTPEITNGRLEVSSELAQLHIFLKRFNKEAEEVGLSQIECSNQTFNKILGALNQEINDKKRNLVEPFFISSVKILLKDLAAEWASLEKKKN